MNSAKISQPRALLSPPLLPLTLNAWNGRWSHVKPWLPGATHHHQSPRTTPAAQGMRLGRDSRYQAAGKDDRACPELLKTPPPEETELAGLQAEGSVGCVFPHCWQGRRCSWRWEAAPHVRRRHPPVGFPKGPRTQRKKTRPSPEHSKTQGQHGIRDRCVFNPQRETHMHTNLPTARPDHWGHPRACERKGHTAVPPRSTKSRNICHESAGDERWRRKPIPTSETATAQATQGLGKLGVTAGPKLFSSEHS